MTSRIPLQQQAASRSSPRPGPSEERSGRARPAPPAPVHQLVDDLGVLCSAVTMPTLCPAISEHASTDVALDDSAAQRTEPRKMLDLELRLALLSTPRSNLSRRRALRLHEALGAPSWRARAPGINEEIANQSCIEGTASRESAWMKAPLEFGGGRSISWAQTKRVRADSRPHPSRDRTGWPQPRAMPPATKTEHVAQWWAGSPAPAPRS